jgi:hypothetical protein
VLNFAHPASEENFPYLVENRKGHPLIALEIAARELRAQTKISQQIDLGGQDD